jgi:hypothetical protein
MHSLDVFWMVVSPTSSHALRAPVVRYDVVVIVELFLADGAFSVGFDNLTWPTCAHLIRPTLS